MKERKQKAAEHTEGKGTSGSPASPVDGASIENGSVQVSKPLPVSDPLTGVLSNLETASALSSEPEEKIATACEPAASSAQTQAPAAAVIIDTGTKAEIERQLAEHIAKPASASMAFSCEKGKHLVEGRRALGLSMNDLDDLSHLQQNYVRAYLELEKTERSQDSEEGRTPRSGTEQEQSGCSGSEVVLSRQVKALPDRAGEPAELSPPAQPLLNAASPLGGTVGGAEGPPLQKSDDLAPGFAEPAVLSNPDLLEASRQVKKVHPEARLEAQQSLLPPVLGEKLSESFCFRRLVCGVPLILTTSPRPSARASFLLVPLPPVLSPQPSGLASHHEEGQPPPVTSKTVSYSFLSLPAAEPPVPSHQSRSESPAVFEEGQASVQIYSGRPLPAHSHPPALEMPPGLRGASTAQDAGEKHVPPPSPAVYLPVNPPSSASATGAPEVGAPGVAAFLRNRDKYYISGPDLVFAAIIALASTASRRHDELFESLESKSSEGSVVTTKVSPCSRPSLIVCHGDSLEAIAERHFNDRRLGHLLADLNESVICQCWLDGKRIVRIKVGQVLLLPLLEDITAFHSRCRSNRDMVRRKLVTIVEDTEVSREVLLETFKPFLKRLS